MVFRKSITIAVLYIDIKKKGDDLCTDYHARSHLFSIYNLPVRLCIMHFFCIRLRNGCSRTDSFCKYHILNNDKKCFLAVNYGLFNAFTTLVSLVLPVDSAIADSISARCEYAWGKFPSSLCVLKSISSLKSPT